MLKVTPPRNNAFCEGGARNTHLVEKKIAKETKAPLCCQRDPSIAIAPSVSLVVGNHGEHRVCVA